MRFYIVDVFAESKYSGNQLAVFRDTAKLSGREMQRIAQEMHYSETTFIRSEIERDGGYDVRIFTPDFELPFAGHPTLGTAFIIQTQILGKPVQKVKLNLGVGQIPVDFSYRGGNADVLWMTQKYPVFGGEIRPGPMAKLLGLRLSDIDQDFQIRQVSTGIPFVIVPLKGLKAVRRSRVDMAAMSGFLRSAKAIAILVFSRETYRKDNDINVRVLGASDNIPEDPATGSANGCLAAYLVEQAYFGRAEVDLRVEQGYEIGRKSLLLLRARKIGKSIDVKVGGKVQFIAAGEFPSD